METDMVEETERDVWLSDGHQFMTGESAYQRHLAFSVEEIQVCSVYFYILAGSHNYSRNTNVKITEQSVRQMCIIKTIFVPLEWEHVLVQIMDAFIHIVL